MIYLLAIATLIIGYFVGRFHREILDRLKFIETALKSKKDVPKPDVHRSSLIDPTDPTQQVQDDWNETLDELNNYE